VLKVLLDYGADPTLQDRNGMTLLMDQMLDHRFDFAARLLQDPRVVYACVNIQNRTGDTALHLAIPNIDNRTGT